MSNIDFFNPSDVPQPRENIKVEKLEAKPYPDGWRVRVTVNVTPFQERPSLEISVFTIDGRPISSLSVIETMVRHMEFTVHIRGLESPAGEYVAKAALYYADDPNMVQHVVETPFSINVT